MMEWIVTVEAVMAAKMECNSQNKNRTQLSSDQIRPILVAALPYMQFSPTGDNHHNARMCPYCSGDAMEKARAIRQALATAIRDWIHETSMSKCNMGSDECLDWQLAYELADRFLLHIPK